MNNSQMGVEEAQEILDYQNNVAIAFRNGSRYAHNILETAEDFLPKTVEERTRFQGFMGGNIYHFRYLPDAPAAFGNLLPKIKAAVDRMLESKKTLDDLQLRMRIHRAEADYDFEALRQEMYPPVARFLAAGTHLQQLISYKVQEAEDVVFNRDNTFERLQKKSLALLLSNVMTFFSNGIDYAEEFDATEAERRVEVLQTQVNATGVLVKNGFQIDALLPEKAQKGIDAFKEAIQEFRQENYFTDEIIDKIDRTNEALFPLFQ